MVFFHVGFTPLIWIQDVYMLMLLVLELCPYILNSHEMIGGHFRRLHYRFTSQDCSKADKAGTLKSSGEVVTKEAFAEIGKEKDRACIYWQLLITVVRVTRISNWPSDVMVTVEGGRTFVADDDVITIPIGVLKASLIEFEPRFLFSTSASRKELKPWTVFSTNFVSRDLSLRLAHLNDKIICCGCNCGWRTFSRTGLNPLIQTALNNAQTKTNSSAFRLMLEKHQLTGPYFNEWFCALKLVVPTEKLQDVFETALPPAPAARADAQALADWVVLFYRHNEVACLMLGTMFPNLYQQFEHNSPLEMVTELQKMYGKPPGVDLQELMNMFHSCNIKRNKQPIVGASSTPQVIAIQGGRVQKYKPQGKAKGKGKGKCKGPQNSYPTKPKKSQPYKKERSKKDGQCYHCTEEGHWKRNCPVYLAELMKKKKKTRGQNVASTSS
nr:zinc finger, CCHC-type [Tanacetum cinerariifolium]